MVQAELVTVTSPTRPSDAFSMRPRNESRSGLRTSTCIGQKRRSTVRRKSSSRWGSSPVASATESNISLPRHPDFIRFCTRNNIARQAGNGYQGESGGQFVRGIAGFTF